MNSFLKVEPINKGIFAFLAFSCQTNWQIILFKKLIAKISVFGCNHVK